MGKLVNYLFDMKREDFDRMTRERIGKYRFPKKVMRLPNIRYSEESDRNLMDVYRPSNTYATFPIVINVHGGNFGTGNKEFNAYYCANIAKLGYVVCSVEYRLLPEATISEQLQDISTAMDYIVDNAGAFGGDPTNVFMTADGAGAYLSVYAMAAQKNHELAAVFDFQPTDVEVRAAGLISGIFNVSRTDLNGFLLSKTLFGKGANRRDMLDLSDPGCDAVAQYLPPCFILTSENDELYIHSERFMKALEQAKIDFRFCSFPKDDDRLTHSFPVYEPDFKESRDSMKYITEYFQMNHRRERLIVRKCG